VTYFQFAAVAPYKSDQLNSVHGTTTQQVSKLVVLALHTLDENRLDDAVQLIDNLRAIQAKLIKDAGLESQYVSRGFALIVIHALAIDTIRTKHLSPASVTN